MWVPRRWCAGICPYEYAAFLRGLISRIAEVGAGPDGMSALVWKAEEACTFDEETFGGDDDGDDEEADKGEDEGGRGDEGEAAGGADAREGSGARTTAGQRATMGRADSKQAAGSQTPLVGGAPGGERTAHTPGAGTGGDGTKAGGARGADDPPSGTTCISPKSKYRHRASKAVQKSNEERSSAVKIQSRMRSKKADQEATGRKAAVQAIQSRSRTCIAKRQYARRQHARRLSEAQGGLQPAKPAGVADDANWGDSASTGAGMGAASAGVGAGGKATRAAAPLIHHRCANAPCDGGTPPSQQLPPPSLAPPPRKALPPAPGQSPRVTRASPRAHRLHPQLATTQPTPVSAWREDMSDRTLSERLLQSESVWRHSRGAPLSSHEGFEPWRRARKSSAMRDVYGTLRSESGAVRRGVEVPSLSAVPSPRRSAAAAPSSADILSATDVTATYATSTVAAGAEYLPSEHPPLLPTAPRLASPRLPALRDGHWRTSPLRRVRGEPSPLLTPETAESGGVELLDERERWNAFCTLVSPRFGAFAGAPPKNPMRLAGQRIDYFPLAVIDRRAHGFLGGGGRSVNWTPSPRATRSRRTLVTITSPRAAAATQAAAPFKSASARESGPTRHPELRATAQRQRQRMADGPGHAAPAAPPVRTVKWTARDIALGTQLRACAL